MSKIEDYAKEIPEEIRRAIRGLDSDYRAAIFVALYKHGELSFSELQKKLEIDKAMLNYHLGKLAESALVQHYYKHELGVDKYSFYSTTHFGQDFLEALVEFLRPTPIRRLSPSEESSMTIVAPLREGHFARALEEFKRAYIRCIDAHTRTEEEWNKMLESQDVNIEFIAGVDANKSAEPRTIKDRKSISAV